MLHPIKDKMVVPRSEQVVKSVSQKLKHYFEVKRLEDGFDLSGVHSPKLNHPPLKARATLQYDGLHDRPLKHYFGNGDVRVRLTNWVAPPNDPEQKAIKKRMTHYMDDMKYVHPYLPDYSYVHYPRGKMILRPEYQGFGLPLPKTKTPHRGGYPILRSQPSHQVSRKEAVRLVNMASRLLVNSQCIDDLEGSSRSSSPRRSRSLTRDRPRSAVNSRQSNSRVQSARGRSRKPSKSAKFVYDIQGRRVRADPHDLSRRDAEKYNYIDHGDEDEGKPMPQWLRKEIRKRDREEGEDVQKKFVRPGSSISGGSGRPSSGRRPSSGGRPGSGRPNGDGRPGSGRPSSGRRSSDGARPGSGRPSSSRPESTRPSSGRASNLDSRPQSGKLEGEVDGHSRPLSAKGERMPPSRVSGDPDKNVTETSAVQTDLDLIDYDNVKTRIVNSGIKAKYRVYVRTGMKLGASTDAEVFITLYGTKGRSEEIVLLDSKSHRAKFRKSQEDEFHITTFHVGELKHIRIGHNRKELGCGWYLENVVVMDLHDRVSYTFSCNKWLSYREEDRKTKRVLEVKHSRNLPPDSELTDSDGDYSDSESPSPIRSSQDESRSPSPLRSGARTPTPHGHPTSSHTSMQPQASPEPAKSRDNESDLDFSESDDEVGQVTGSPRQVTIIDSQSTPPSGKSTNTPSANQGFAAGYKAGLEAAAAVPGSRDYEEVEGAPTESTASDDYCIHTASKDGKMNLVKEILNRQPHLINAVSDEGYTPTHLAAGGGHIELVKWLAINCADLNAVTKSGYHVVHMAASNGHVQCLMVLNAVGSKMDVTTRNHGQTPLHVAAMGGHVEVCEWLLDNKLKLDAKDRQGRTALDLARENGQSEVEEFLRQRSGERTPPKSSPRNGSSKYGRTGTKSESRHSYTPEEESVPKQPGFYGDGTRDLHSPHGDESRDLPDFYGYGSRDEPGFHGDGSRDLPGFHGEGSRDLALDGMYDDRPPMSSSQVVEPSETWTNDERATIFTEGTHSTSTPRLDLTRDDPRYGLPPV